MRSRLPVLLLIVLLVGGGIWYFTRDTRTREERAEEFFEKGEELFRQGDYQGAIEAMERCVELGQGHYPEPFAALAVCHYHLGQYELAKRQCERVLELNPGDDGTRVVYADTLLRTIEDSGEAWRRANAELSKLSEKGRRNPTVLYNLACLYAEYSRPELALRYLSYAIKADPSLKEVAKKDSCLDSIRHTEQFKRLVR